MLVQPGVHHRHGRQIQRLAGVLPLNIVRVYLPMQAQPVEIEWIEIDSANATKTTRAEFAHSSASAKPKAKGKKSTTANQPAKQSSPTR
jgi:hypothetical protein